MSLAFWDALFYKTYTLSIHTNTHSVYVPCTVYNQTKLFQYLKKKEKNSSPHSIKLIIDEDVYDICNLSHSLPLFFLSLPRSHFPSVLILFIRFHFFHVIQINLLLLPYSHIQCIYLFIYLFILTLPYIHSAIH